MKPVDISRIAPRPYRFNSQANLSLLPDVHVLCVGDVMLDRFTYGEVTRISPEAPIPILQITKEERMLGGAGNVARNLYSLGCRVSFGGVTGLDLDAVEIATLFEQMSNCDSLLLRDPNRHTSVKRRYLSSGHHLLRADSETITPVGQELLRQLLDWFRNALPHCQVVVLSDYGKGVLSGKNVEPFIELANEANKPIVVDPKGAFYSRYRNAKVIKPNAKELAEATNMAIDSEEGVTAAARRILTETDAHAVVVTLGAAGMMLVPASGEIMVFSAEARDVFDVSGAGDTAMAALAASLGTGMPMGDSVYLANVAASIVVGKLGTAVVEQEELRSKCDWRGLIDSGDPLCSGDLAADRVRAWVSSGLRIGLVSGSFDTIGQAEMAILESVRSRCDRLVAVIVEDEPKYFGRETRNIQSSQATMLRSLASTDLVLIHPRHKHEEFLKLVACAQVFEFSVCGERPATAHP